MRIDLESGLVVLNCLKLCLLLMPIVSCFIGVFFLGEELTSKKLLGILVVLSGAAILLLRSRIHHEGKLPPQRAEN